MGINYKTNNINKIKNLKDKIKLNNKNLKITFYTTLLFWGTHNIKASASLNNFLLGKRHGFSILNAEHHITLLKRAAKILFELRKCDQKILFINQPLNQNFDGIIKSLALRALQPYSVGKWSNGFFRKKHHLFYSAFFFNPSKSIYALREANRIGIPIVSLNGLDNDFKKPMYPIFCNNLQGDSIFFNSFILSNSIIEGHLFRFIKKKF